jgi:hypothetical protein
VTLSELAGEEVREQRKFRSHVWLVGIVINDYKLTVLTSGLVPSFYYTNLQTVLNYAQSKGISVVAGMCRFGS